MNSLLHHLPSPISGIRSSLTDHRQVRLMIKRDDLLQPTGNERLCGNKVRKLKYNLKAARAGGFIRLLTFGGAFSNHIAAVAAAGQAYGFETTGLIRGEPHHTLNPTLAQAQADGMQLHFIDRESYRKKEEPELIDRLRRQYGEFYLIPEGGTNDLALKGSAEIISEIREQIGALPDYLCVACGTGGTLAGMIIGCAGESELIGVSALKGNFMSGTVSGLLGSAQAFSNWSVRSDYHFGGYARFPASLQQFVQEFEARHGILADPVYTSRLFFGVMDLIGKGYFRKGSSVVIVHSGGLQGWGGFGGEIG